MEAIERIADRALEEAEFLKAAEEERELYSLMIRLKLGGSAILQRAEYSKKLAEVS